MTAAQNFLTHYTYDDYVHWEGRWELIEGYPIAMSPMPVPRHQRAATALRYELEFAIRKAKCKKCKVHDPLDYKVAEDTILQPDVLVLCKPADKKFIDFAPVFVAEIFSPSTVLRDRNKKFEIYQQEGVQYYLMVDAEKEMFSLYEMVEGKYVSIQHDFTQPFSFLFDGCKVEVVLNEVWENL